MLISERCSKFIYNFIYGTKHSVDNLQQRFWYIFSPHYLSTLMQHNSSTFGTYLIDPTPDLFIEDRLKIVE